MKVCRLAGRSFSRRLAGNIEHQESELAIQLKRSEPVLIVVWTLPQTCPWHLQREFTQEVRILALLGGELCLSHFTFLANFSKTGLLEQLIAWNPSSSEILEFCVITLNLLMEEGRKLLLLRTREQSNNEFK